VSLWADYFRDKGFFVAENPSGFMTAIVHDGVCLVDNFYVCPGARGTNAAYRLTLEVVQEAERRGCHTFAAEIYKSDPAYAYNLRASKAFRHGTNRRDRI
jgi:GNAT superfamily N-acetyltransferase